MLQTAEHLQIWEKKGHAGKTLRRELLKIDFESYGGPYVEQFALIPKNGTPVAIPDATWAELDQKGKLVFARFGKVFRGSLSKDGLEEVELMDLNPNKPPRRAANNSMEATPDGAPHG